VQIAITIFLLVMAALMIPGGKLTDRYGRSDASRVGLVVYGIGALLSAAAPAWVCSSSATRSSKGSGRRC
jgi:MFS family permease